MIFRGNTPYVLVILRQDQPEGSLPATAIDLDEPGWAKTHAHLMRVPGRWILARKADNQPVFTMTVAVGEQPYYTSRVLGSAWLPPPDVFDKTPEEMGEIKVKAEVRAFGIGKKRLDGHVDRMWILPNGSVCAGDDVDVLGTEMAKARLFALLRSKGNGPDRGRQEDLQEERQEGGPGAEVHRP